MYLIPFLLLFVVLTGSICAFGYVIFVKPVNMLDQLASSTAAKIVAPKPNEIEGRSASGVAKLFESLGKLLPYSPSDLRVVKRDLVAAGFRSSYSTSVFLGMKLLSCAILLLTAILLRDSISDGGLNRILIPVSAAVGGYLAPGFVLGRLVRRRQDKIRMALPDVLDLLVICTEAGCALDKAMVNVSQEFVDFHPVISEELALVNMEMLAGSSRIEALRNFAARTGEEELKKLVGILVQTDRFGTSVADALRTQSEFMRVQRRQRAEERAGKVGVKLVFPIFFFCLPSLMIIVAGPGMLQLFKNLLPALNSIN